MSGRGTRGNRRGPDPMLAVLVLQLFQHIQELGPNKPVATLALMAGQVVLHFADLLLPGELAMLVPSIQQGCLLPFNVIKRAEWPRVLWAAFLHLDEWHLYYNMASLLSKGALLEPALGSLGFLALVGELVVLSGGLMAGGMYWLGTVLQHSELVYTCAAGFSAVLFGLKYVATCQENGSEQLMIGSWTMPVMLNVPTKHIAWAELLLVHFLFPGTSFSGHLCGILAGVLHVHLIAPFIGRLQRTQGRTARARPNNTGPRHAAAADGPARDGGRAAAEAAMLAALQRQAQQQARGLRPTSRSRQ